MNEPQNRARDLSNLGSKDRSLVERAARLAFGVFGLAGSDLRPGGSGIIVAPDLAITARHVMKDLYRLEGWEPTWPGRRQHDANLFQVLDPFDPEASPKASWYVESECLSKVTDLALLGIRAACPVAERLRSELAGQYFEWRLELPPPGAIVFALGFPKLSVGVEPDGEHARVGAPFTWQSLHVTSIYPRHHDAGQYSFPGFLAAADPPIGGGFSGGAVFYDGKLCGLVSGGLFDCAYVTALGPLALMDYTLGEGDKDKHRFSDLFDKGVIAASDWPRMRDRLWKDHDEFENPVVCYRGSR